MLVMTRRKGAERSEEKATERNICEHGCCKSCIFTDLKEVKTENKWEIQVSNVIQRKNKAKARSEEKVHCARQPEYPRYGFYPGPKRGESIYCLAGDAQRPAPTSL